MKMILPADSRIPSLHLLILDDGEDRSHLHKLMARPSNYAAAAAVRCVDAAALRSVVLAAVRDVAEAAVKDVVVAAAAACETIAGLNDIFHSKS